jgi:hypothetical protein
MEVWQRFTSTARRAILLAHSEAARSRAQLIGTEHLLLGLLRLGEGSALEALVRAGVDVERLAADVQSQLAPSEHVEPNPEVSFTPDAQQTLSLAYNEAGRMCDSHVGTEHILLGLLRLGKGPAFQVLRERGADLEGIRRVVEEINAGSAAAEPAAPPSETGYQAYHYLEGYLFGTVTPRFASEGSLGAFDLFCIVRWKAEHTEGKVARQFIDRSGVADLEGAARRLTTGVAQEPKARERMRYVVSKGFRLPLASAILTVLYPEEFMVYDPRLCGQLPEGADFHNLANVRNFERLWDGYQAYLEAVREATPAHLSLRHREGYLWGKAFYEQLTGELARGFGEGE